MYHLPIINSPLRVARSDCFIHWANRPRDVRGDEKRRGSVSDVTDRRCVFLKIVDTIIDYFGMPLDQPQSHDPIFYRWDLDKSVLNSWALVSKACNHRVRYYLFSHCKIIAKPSELSAFALCPDVILTYTRFLYIYRPRSLQDIQAVISRFPSSPSSGSNSNLRRYQLGSRRSSGRYSPMCAAYGSKSVFSILSRW